MYQAFNMQNDYSRAVQCPYGCPTQLREDQLALHLTRCWRKDEVNFGHCRYNFFHIYRREHLAAHELTCPSKTDMKESDFTCEPTKNNTWEGDDEYSKQYAGEWPQAKQELKLNRYQQLLKSLMRCVSCWG